MQVQRDAADCLRGLKDIEASAFDEKAYADRRAQLAGLIGTPLDEACTGAGNGLVERMLRRVIAMKTAGNPWRDRED